ncbi:MAG TPA: long-chain fatty acid--CoA ligase [Desulfobacteraceae bacterium]|nr:long-chain fatty acid--CoA ligase [Desulfobacteraceae bacterium]HPQ27972.1 long-chain fatty acid--CoA ligase [Desulfobacteraceae bacterium]
MVIGSLPVQCARRYPEKTATIFKGQTQTFDQFNKRVNALANGLRGLGLKKGDKVSIISRNNPQMLEAMFAAAKCGIIFVPINFRLAAPELIFVINDAEIDVLFVGDDYQEIIHNIQKDITCPNIIALRDAYEDMIAKNSTTEPEIEVVPDDMFGIFYTSGTTGGPKGVMLTHHNFLSAAVNHVIAYQMSPADVCYHSQPFYHTMQASLALCTFYVGGTNFIVDNFDGHEFWAHVRDYGITSITLVFTMLVDVLDAFEEGKYQKGSLHSFTVGGQSVPVDVIRRTYELMGQGMIFQVYGLTEASPLLTYLPRQEMVLDGEASRRLASIGKELFTCHVRVVDDEDRDVAPGEIGEIIAQGPNVMTGYWKRQEETEAALRGGWLRTGDMATVDNDGYIYIVDRKKDLIISGGENISSREVEEVIRRHPAVHECAVIGIPDKKWGEQVKACVVLRQGQAVSEADMIEFTRNNLARYKTPKSVVFLPSLPKDPLGKIQKRILRDNYVKSAA